MRTLVEAQFGPAGDAGPVTFPGGAALVDASGTRAWILADDEPAKLLGRGMAWADARDVEDLHLVVGEVGGLLARRASQFARPPTVWWARDRELHPVGPEPVPNPVRPHPDAVTLAALLEQAGATVVVEHGVVAGEILGLEIARVIVDDNGPRIEVGVGRHDRDAFATVHGDLPTAAALAEMVATVRRHRRSGAPSHPLHRLAAERWLRESVIARPEIVGARHLERAAGTVLRTNLKTPAPAPAIGTDTAGGPLVVVCSVGVDLDLVPSAADVRLATDPAARLVLAVPERDAVTVTRRLAEALTDPATVVPIGGDWRGLAVP